SIFGEYARARRVDIMLRNDERDPGQTCFISNSAQPSRDDTARTSGGTNAA
ncbi:hypothetical protein chiPu_0031921, partial [Chiloscyllium punctatum]|nr:hypothetical protein [Chiloscyllium punctatum]